MKNNKKLSEFDVLLIKTKVLNDFKAASCPFPSSPTIRLEAELEKLQKESVSGESMLFSTPCWNMNSPWDQSGMFLCLSCSCCFVVAPCVAC